MKTSLYTTDTSGNKIYIAILDDNSSVTFNYSTLIANKQYSPLFNTTFDLMSDAEIKAQMDLWVANGTLPNDNVLAVNMNKRVRSVGKNLFDKSVKVPNIFTTVTDIPDGVRITGTYYAQFNIRLKGNNTYIMKWVNTTISGTPYTSWRYLYNDLTISRQIQSNASLLAEKDVIAIHLYVASATSASSDFTQIQLEQGTVATSYVPYANTDLYLQANKVGYKLPNGVADTIEYRNGKYYFVQRVQEYTLQASDVIRIFERAESVSVYVLKPANFIGYNNENNYDTALLVDGWLSRIPGTDIISAINIGRFGTVTDSTQIVFSFPLGTSLAQGQAALAGTVIYYQLATPIETEILALGNAQGLAGGTVYIDDVMADSNLYTSKYDIENTAYPIKSLDRIVKINADGSQTELAVSSATIAGDGLSFTHPSLVANDIVWIAYAYNVANLFKSNTFVTYYDNPFIAVQPNGTPRRIVFAVDDSGVVTVSSQAV